MCKFDSVNLNTESNLQMNVSLEIVGGCHHHHTHVVHLSKCYREVKKNTFYFEG